MKFSYYRLFVENAAQTSLLADLRRPHKEILIEAFDHTTPIYVKNKSQTFVYKRIARQGDLILGKIAKRSTVSVEHPAEEDFAKELMETWPGVFIVVNVSDDPIVGQSIAIECDRSLFPEPLAQLEKLAAYINRLILKPTNFEIRVNPITELQDFWKIASEQSGNMRSLTLKIAAPNLFGARDEFSKDLKQAQKSYRLTDATFVLENSENNLRLPKDDPFLNESLDYVTAGGGTFKIKLSDRKVISSEDNIASKDIGAVEIEVQFNEPSTALAFSDKLFSWLRHRE